jgi:glyceraldehyde 3-phosphate dehydrogenase
MKKNKPVKGKIKIALNGLGRIGRVFFRIAHNNPNFEIAALHSRSGLETYAHLLKYDSTYGTWDKEVKVKNNKLYIDDIAYPFVSEEDGKLPWKKMKIDMVVDATGKFNKREMAKKHLEDGAKYIVATAPMDDGDGTFIASLNDKTFDPNKHFIISAASCTTVCSSLVAKVLEENFGIERAFINTIHAFTSDQELLDGAHKDLRRARTASESIIPTCTGVSKTITKIYPQLKDKISAISLRVPALNPSVVSYTASLKKKVTKEEVNKAFEKMAKNELRGNLEVCNLPLVSIDFRGNSHGAVLDALSTQVMDKKLVNVIVWYDNEWGYVSQAIKMIERLAKTISKKE